MHALGRSGEGISISPWPGDVGDDGRVQIRIEATKLPGRTCGPGPDFPGYENIHVGVQRRDRPGELMDLHPGDAPSAVWTLDSRTVPAATGVAFAGRYIQNRLGGRFIYLSWGEVDDDGVFKMFRRAKVMLDGVTRLAPDVFGVEVALPKPQPNPDSSSAASN